MNDIKHTNAHHDNHHSNHQGIGGIEKYLMTRLMSHQKWYDNKRLLDKSPMMDINQQAIFGVIHGLVMAQLSMGHTTLMIHRESKHIHLQDVARSSFHLSDWQWQLLSPMMSMMNESLNGLIDFQGLFTAIDELKDDKNNIIDYVKNAKQYLSEVFHTYEISLPNQSNKAHQLSYLNFYQSLAWILWFYYYSQYLIKQSFDELMLHIANHPLFGVMGSDKPLIYHYNHHRLAIWLHRSFYAETQLLARLFEICHAPMSALPITADESLNDEQRHAVSVMSAHAVSVITGGPGTGKTFTVAQVVKALLADDKLNLALVAPTGKAGQRMKESLQQALADTDVRLPEPMTIHRLLGIGTKSIPRHHKSNPLPHQLIIVDEASMLGVELATWLLSAVKSGTRVILLGDAHQLSAVEAGAVLADLCQLPMLAPMRAQLSVSRRFGEDSGVGKLAKFIHEPTSKTWTQFEQLVGQESQLDFMEINTTSVKSFYEKLKLPYHNYFELTKQSKNTFHQMNDVDKKHTVKQLMMVLNRYRILTASHLGICGDDIINQDIVTHHQHHLGNQRMYEWYHGRPIMITKNRYDLGLYNGDIGICLKSGRGGGQMHVYFDHGDDLKQFNISMLDGDVANTVYAMTIHKSQGSEFDEVAICFDDSNERLLSKELIYTAITRAKKSVMIYGTPNAVLTAINKPTIRQTGLGILANMTNGG